MAHAVIEMPTHTPPPDPPAPEPWVGMKTLAAHLDLSYGLTARKVRDGEIPGHAFKCGKKTYWRFKLSEVDRALSEPKGEGR